jgi:MoaA/NifB/PqqE/SkfB family radical SAM enzyme
MLCANRIHHGGLEWWRALRPEDAISSPAVSRGGRRHDEALVQIGGGEPLLHLRLNQSVIAIMRNDTLATHTSNGEHRVA